MTNYRMYIFLCLYFRAYALFCLTAYAMVWQFARTVSSVLGKEVVKRAAAQAVQKAATDAVKKLGEKGVQKVSSLISKSRDKPSGPSDREHSSPRLTSKSEDILIKHIKSPSGPLDREHSSFGLTSKSQNILRKYTAPPPPPPPVEEDFNLNALIDGSAIRIEDYIKRWK